MINKRIIGVLLIVMMALTVVGCVDSKTTTQYVERQAIEDNQARLMNTTPLPKLTDSLERENIAKRLELTNTKDKIFHIYLIDNGRVMAYFTGGKVSCVSSYMVTQQQIVDDPYGYTGQVVEAPDLDGSYGINGEAVYFWTTDGKYVEWKGAYMVSDYPYSLVTPPMIYMSSDVTPMDG